VWHLRSLGPDDCVEVGGAHCSVACPGQEQGLEQVVVPGWLPRLVEHRRVDAGPQNVNVDDRDLVGAEVVAHDPSGCLRPDAGQLE